MSDYTPTTGEVWKMYKAGAWLRGDRNPDQFNPAVYEPIYFAEFDRWLVEVERAAAVKALTEMANELSLLDDGGKRGLAGHSKSSASAITHRHAVAVVRARAEAYRREETE